MQRRHFSVHFAKVASAAAVAVLLAVSPAAAQEIGQDVLSYLGTFAFADSLHTWDQAKDYNAEAVLDHTRDGFTPRGVTLPNGHMLYPSLKAKTVYDDNIFLDPVKTGDLRTSLEGSVEFQANLPRNALKIHADAETVKFRDHPNFDFTDVSFFADTRLDLDAADSIGASIQTRYGHLEEFLPYDPANRSAATPNWTTRGTAGYMHDAGRTNFATGFDYQRSYFYDAPTYGGGISDESAGDYDSGGLFALVNYRWSPGYRAFAAARINREMPLHERSAYRTNTGFWGETGLVYELDPLLQVTLYGGYKYINFDDPRQYDLGALTFRGALQWLPTRRMTINLDASQNLQRTVNGPTYGALVDTVHGQLRYDIYHNIIGVLDASIERDQFIGNDRLDNSWRASAGLDYLFNENLALTLSAEHRERTSNDSNFDFSDNRYMVELKVSQ